MVFECLVALALLGQVGKLDAIKGANNVERHDVVRREAQVKPAAKSDGSTNLRPLGPSKLITSPYDAVVLALGDAELKSVKDQKYVRYLWVPDWMDRQMAFAKASLVINSTLSRVPTIVQPAALADGRLIRVDFLALTTSYKQADELVALFENLAARESFFHIRKATVEALLRQEDNFDFGIGETVEIQTTDPETWIRGEIKGREGANFRVQMQGRDVIDVTGPKSVRKLAITDGFARKNATRLTADYAKPELHKLGHLLSTDVPIMRLDEFNTFAFDSVNGGQYYQLTGLEGELLTVLSRLAGPGAGAKISKALEEQQRTGRVDSALAKASSITVCSDVTGRQRLTIVFNGDNMNPLYGAQLVFVTLDIAEDNDDPDSDPFRNPLDFGKFDGGEAIILMPNGLLCYVVFDAKLKIITSVPDTVAHNTEAVKVRGRAATVRVSAGLVCARCHERDANNYGYQAIVNDGYESQHELGSTIGDAGRRRDPQRANQETASQFQGDLTGPLDSARLTYQKQAHRATGYATTRPVVFALGDDYWGYWYDMVDPVRATRDLGFNLNRDDSIAVLLAIAPSLENDPDTAGVDDQTLKEDKILGRIKDGKRVTGMQWRTLFPLIAGRARNDQVREKIAVLLSTPRN